MLQLKVISFITASHRLRADDFNGKVAEYEFYIKCSQTSRRKQPRQINFETTNETIVYDIVIVNEKD